MNEKIKELYEECSNSVYSKTDGYGNDHYKGVTNYERFAELIVQECCDIFVELRTRPADLAVKQIKEHFGVE